MQAFELNSQENGSITGTVLLENTEDKQLYCLDYTLTLMMTAPQEADAAQTIETATLWMAERLKQIWTRPDLSLNDRRGRLEILAGILPGEMTRHFCQQAGKVTFQRYRQEMSKLEAAEATLPAKLGDLPRSEALH